MPKKGQTDLVVDEIVRLKLDEFASNKTILKYLSDLGYKQSFSYTLIEKANEQIKEMYSEEFSDLSKQARGQLEQMLEDAIKYNNIKLALSIRQEMNKLFGLYEAEKVDVKIEFKAKFPGFENED